MAYPSGQRALLAVLLLALTLGLAACAGSAELSKEHRDGSDPGLIASRFVPRVSTLGHSPDSLRAVSVRADSGDITLEQSYPSLLRQSAVRERYKDAPSHSHRPFRSILGGSGAVNVHDFGVNVGYPHPSQRFAVLRSTELLLGELAWRRPDSLSEATFRQRLRQKTAFSRDTLRIDVYYLYGETPSRISRHRRRSVELQDDDGHVYFPVRTSFRTGNTSAHGTAYWYLRASYYFRRSAKKRDDLITNTSSLQLRVRRLHRDPLYFEWRWDRSEFSARR